MTTEIFEGLWDCSNCGMIGIPGRVKVCPSCKDPQDSSGTPSEDWYLPEGRPVIVDKEVLDQFDDGADWNCGHCGTSNNGAATVCSCCNQPLDFDDTVNRTVVYDDSATHFDEAPDPADDMVEDKIERAERAITTPYSEPRRLKNLTRPLRDLPRIGKDTKFYQDIRDRVYRDAEERERLSALSPLMRLWRTRRRLVLAGVAIVVVLAMVGIAMIVADYFHRQTATVSGTVTITELEWKRDVSIEQYRTITRSDWSYPSDARVQGQVRKIRTYTTIVDGQKEVEYTDYETRYRPEPYTDFETRYRPGMVPGTCTQIVSRGNGSFQSQNYPCQKPGMVSYQEPVRKIKQVPYTVEVPKTKIVQITHDEPVWDTWYTFDTDRWVVDRWVTATGKSPEGLKWPEPTGLSQNDQPGDQVGEEKVGTERREGYTIMYTDSKGVIHLEGKGSYTLWSSLEIGEQVPAVYYERNGEFKSVDWSSALVAK